MQHDPLSHRRTAPRFVVSSGILSIGQSGVELGLMRMWMWSTHSWIMWLMEWNAEVSGHLAETKETQQVVGQVSKWVSCGGDLELSSFLALASCGFSGAVERDWRKVSPFSSHWPLPSSDAVTCVFSFSREGMCVCYPQIQLCVWEMVFVCWSR